mgnify:CR=1 FL=1
MSWGQSGDAGAFGGVVSFHVVKPVVIVSGFREEVSVPFAVGTDEAVSGVEEVAVLFDFRGCGHFLGCFDFAVYGGFEDHEGVALCELQEVLYLVFGGFPIEGSEEFAYCCFGFEV